MPLENWTPALNVADSGAIVPMRVDEQPFNPGHYCKIEDDYADSTIDDIATRPGVKGVIVILPWKDIETSLGVYDWTIVQRRLDRCIANGMRMILFIHDKWFQVGTPLPAYLMVGSSQVPTYASGTYCVHQTRNPGSFMARRWNAYVQDRFIALLNALGAQYNGNAWLEGIALQETGVGIVLDADLLAEGFTPEGMMGYYLRVLPALRLAFPKQRRFWYTNWIDLGQNYVDAICEQAVGNDWGITMGGPDLHPEPPNMDGHQYKDYQNQRLQFGRMKQFGSSQNTSHAILRAGGVPTKYYTPYEIWDFAANYLGCDYLFWNYRVGGWIGDEYGTNDDDDIWAAYPSWTPSVTSWVKPW